MLQWIKKISSRPKRLGDFFFEISAITGLKVKSTEAYELAFRHSSATTKIKGIKLNNERLEYLGDSILGAVVSDFLYHNFPSEHEGFLSRMRSKIVSRNSLNEIGLGLGLNALIIKGNARSKIPSSLLGDTLEALIGAVYLDHGYDKCANFINSKILDTFIELDILENRISSYKSNLLEWGQKHKLSLQFKLSGSWGESHNRYYEMSLFCDNKFVSKHTAQSKKKAEEEASKKAYDKLVG